MPAIEEVVMNLHKADSIWLKITPTQENYPSTHIPKSFILDVNGQKIWIAPNVTDHFIQQVANEVLPKTDARQEKKLKEAVRESLVFGMPIKKTKLAQGELIAQLHNVLKEAMLNGMPPASTSN